MSALPPPPPPARPAPPAYSPIPAPVPVKAPVARLGRTIVSLLVVTMAITVTSVPVSLETARRARAFLRTGGTEERFTAAAGTQGLLGVMSGALTLTIGILTMIWMFRMARNHRSMGRTGATWGPGWAIGGWFCPPVLWIIPWLMIRELWKASDPATAPYDGSWKQNKASAITTVWWVLYAFPPLVNVALMVGRLRLGAGFGPIESARLSDVPAAQTVTVAALSLAAAASYLVLVRELTARHGQLIGEA